MFYLLFKAKQVELLPYEIQKKTFPIFIHLSN